MNENFAELAGAVTELEDVAAANPPVGTVIASLLSEAHMEQLVGDDWVLADGRDVAGTVYETITGSSSVPDLRGAFLRGTNDGRADDMGNPEGDLAVGTFQEVDVISHRHHGPGVSGTQLGPVHSGHGVPTNETSNSYWGGYTGGAETRPRNVTVRFYVRVDS